MSTPIIGMNSPRIQMQAAGSSLYVQSAILTQGAQVAHQTDTFEVSGDRPGQAGRGMEWRRQFQHGNVESQTTARFFTGNRGDATEPGQVKLFAGAEAEYATQTTIHGKDGDTVIGGRLRGSAGHGGALGLKAEAEPERFSLEAQAKSETGAQAEIAGDLQLKSLNGSLAKVEAGVGFGPKLAMDLNGGLGRDNQEGETRLRLQAELKALVGIDLQGELVLKDEDIEGACRNVLGGTAGSAVAGAVTGTLDCLPRAAHLLKRLACATGEAAQSTISLLT